MTVDEAKTHFTKLAQDAGLSKEETEHVLKAMENERFRSTVSNGYKRQEDYSREMDAVRVEKQRLKDWYEKEELPKYQRYQQSIDQLEAYRSQYGELDDGLNNGRYTSNRGNGNGNGATDGYMRKEDVSKYVEEQLRQRDGAYVGLTKTAIRIGHDYARRFNEVLDVDAVEKLALDKGLALDQAYKEFIAPKEQAAMEARHKDEIERAKAEAVRDYASRHQLPIDTKPKDAHPFWDRKPPETGKTEADADHRSREEFMSGWNNYEQELAHK
jgi:hypothetical protein